MGKRERVGEAEKGGTKNRESGVEGKRERGGGTIFGVISSDAAIFSVT